MTTFFSFHSFRSGVFMATGLGLILGMTACSGSKKVTQEEPASAATITVPLGGNSWKNGTGEGRITRKGIRHWKDKSASFATYVRLGQTGKLQVWLDGDTSKGESKLAVSIHHKNHVVKIADHQQEEPVYAGEWKIRDTGYVAIHIKGIDKEGAVFARIKNVLLGGSATEGRTAYTKNNKGNYFYWGRRGPSVHLRYLLPKAEEAEWFYNEVTVPKGDDVVGSYFMADGFSGGYFGMQVNSPQTRHILFSVWSPYDTDNPKDIPDSMRIELLKKGPNVHAGEFGNEGSGGQSYLNYMWQAGHTYKFLLHGVPDGPNHTIYTAYFYAPEKGKWQLIASFRRPKTHSYLQGLHSFLENFNPRQGDKERQVLFGNQWIRTKDGQWISLDKAVFTTDNTGRKGYRKDFAGGAKNTFFFLKNGGFFDAYTQPDQTFERKQTGPPPQIDFSKLP